MITSRTKRQLLVFVVITLLGVSFVGARYARLDRLFYDSSYQVKAHFLQSGGIFTGAEVTYRGVGVGRVSDMVLTQDGVDVVLEIDKGYDEIPADTIALVGNKSAVGEQYVELDPRTDGGPYLRDGSDIAAADTRIPVSTTEILTNTDALVRSVPQDHLRTVVSELGAAFKGTSDDLAQIIDTSNAFIAAANQSFDVTTALIEDANTVLRTQADKATAIRDLSRDLALFSGTLAANDNSLRALLDVGAAAAGELRTFLGDNEVDLGVLINNLVSTGEVVVKHLPGIRQILVLYPYMVAGGYTVAAKTSSGYVARFGLVLNTDPAVCSAGYDPKERRTPLQLADKPMDMDAKCTSPPSRTNARGAQNAPRTGTAFRAPVATYDLGRGTVTWTDQAAQNQDQDRNQAQGRVVYDGGSAQVFGKDAWSQLLLGPVTQTD